MRYLKSVLFVIHLQVLVNLIVLVLLYLGIGPLILRLNVLENTLVWMLIFGIDYFVLGLVFFNIQPKYLKLPAKPFILSLLLFSVYTVCFAIAQTDPQVWRILWLVHLPLGWLVHSLVSSQLNLTLQLSFMLAVFSPGIGLKGAEWISQRLQRIKQKAR